MKIVIKTKNLKLDRSLENFIEEKINDLEKYFDSFFGKGKPKVEAWVEIGKETMHHKKGPFFRTECQIQLPRKDIRAESISENLYLSINEVKDELQRELKNYKNKMTAKMKRGARVLKKEIHLSPEARLYRKGRIREEGI
ncbi:MAG: ribosome-associated translation inhibitor RaiA [bacterium]|nr:ribosome-associated translation inhibitor RaiA [bacterium]